MTKDDISNSEYFDKSGFLKLEEIARARGHVVYISAWKVDMEGPFARGALCRIRVYDDGNQCLPRDGRWKIIGSAHNGGKLLLELE
jgi:hypothetical protein